MPQGSLTSRLKDEARRLGFDLAGACPAVAPSGLHHFQAWLESGYAGEMHYLASRQKAYEHPRHLLDGARSLLMLAVAYRTVEPAAVAPGEGRVARYAWGQDYHLLIRDRLHALADWLRAEEPTAHTRGVVDTAPLLETEFASLAGLGWVGKNRLLLNRELGSWFFLAALVTDLELDYDAPHEADHCGTCRACLDACPTGAFVAPYVLDSRRCISYLTIELDGPVAPELRAGLGDWVFGCDVCQDVCPWNRKPPISDEPALLPREATNPLDLIGLLALDESTFRARFRNTPLWRPKRRGLLRSAALVLGNQRARHALPALVQALGDVEPLVRGACGWALGQIGGNEAQRALNQRLSHETDPLVRSELESALTQPHSPDFPSH